MAIYTSYYSSRDIPEDGVKVSISVTAPRGFVCDEQLRALAPDSETLWAHKGRRIDDAEYSRRYNTKLDEAGESVGELLADVSSRHPGKDIFLLCWEKPGEFCHRRLLADWLKAHYSMDIPEWTGRRVAQERIGDLFTQQEAGRTVRVAVVGSREFGDYRLLKEFLDAELGRFPAGTQFELVSGGARGADSLAERYGNEKGIPVKVFAADWNRYGKSAGFRRNVDIIENCDLCVAFWDGQSRGTAHDFTICEEKGKPYVVNFYQSGKVERHGEPRVAFSVQDSSSKDKVIDVWHSSHDGNSWLSNMATRPFTLEGNRWQNVESYFQWKKAMTFKDYDSANLIKRTDDGVKCRDIGRHVKGFRPGIWTPMKYFVMKDAIRQSFLDNPELLERFKGLGDVRFTHSQDPGEWRRRFPMILKSVQDEFIVGQEESAKVVEKAVDAFYHVYSYASAVKEPITGMFASEFAGPATWSRILDFDVPGLPDFQGLRYIDFKDCTNVYFKMKDGEAYPVGAFPLSDIQAVNEGLNRALGSRVSEGVPFYVGNAPTDQDVVFVFGSNPLGVNGNPARGTGGAALVAHLQYGVAQGERMNNCMSESGRAYGLVTVRAPGARQSLSLDEIRTNFERMNEVAKKMPDKRFCVAYRHLDKPSLCGYTGREMIGAIGNIRFAPNVFFSQEWAKELNVCLKERESQDLFSGRRMR